MYASLSQLMLVHILITQFDDFMNISYMLLSLAIWIFKEEAIKNRFYNYQFLYATDINICFFESVFPPNLAQMNFYVENLINSLSSYHWLSMKEKNQW